MITSIEYVTKGRTFKKTGKLKIMTICCVIRGKKRNLDKFI